MQQSYARVGGRERNGQCHRPGRGRPALERRITGAPQVTLVRDFDASVPKISVDKHKVLQILVNLIPQWQRACGEAGQQEKILTVGIRNRR